MSAINKKVLIAVLGLTSIFVIAATLTMPIFGISTDYSYRSTRSALSDESGMMPNWRTGGIGLGMMGNMMGTTMGTGCGMSGGMSMMGGPYEPDVLPIGINVAEQLAQEYLSGLNDPDLMIDEIEEYSNNYYVSFKERGTGRGAIEIIIDRFYGSINLEPQSMMWNLKYGMMGYLDEGPKDMPITPGRALDIAQTYLDSAYPGTRAGSLVAYYGYYTIMTTLNGEHYGMLSVNGYSGQVWYHTWHGMFLGETEG
jgi:hypothetical protein